MMIYLDEAQVEKAAVDYFRELGYEYIHGAHIAPDLPAPPACAGDADRGSARQAVKPVEAIEAVRKVESPCC